jgi:ribosomal protein S12 methylthiotransferase accessory factor
LKRGASAVLDPAALILPDDTSYTPRRAFTWVAGIDLLSGRETLAPLDAVVCPASEGILPDVDTNGLASGNTLLR